ncbi:Acg family FMN-binding oxidoreductase [Saccharomonospora xinjiangensis]|nr:nitroreductase family protein [Saccharomonospora xinjiangensis]
MAGRSSPDERTRYSALMLACRAPSLHNTQPWRWRIETRSVHLFAERSRRLPAIDPHGRQLIVSCGAALHHARVAFASLGWRTDVTRLPNPALPDHLAALEFGRLAEISPETVRLALAAAHRHTDRRHFLPAPIPAELRDQLVAAAGEEDASLTLADDDEQRRELAVAIRHADSVQHADPAYAAELAEWTGRSDLAEEGIPARNLPRQGGRGMIRRDFDPEGRGTLEVPPALDDGAMIAVLSTGGDDERAWLRAGEALSAVLLTATEAGLATCPLSQIAEVGESRDAVRRYVLTDGSGYPQIALRLGWPPSAEDIPNTYRRALDDVIETAAQAGGRSGGSA